MCAGEGAADRAYSRAEEERGVSERSPPLREKSQGAHVPGVVTAHHPDAANVCVMVFNSFMFCVLFLIGSLCVPAVRRRQEDSAEDAGSDQ